MDPAALDDSAVLRRERDLYLRLLELGHETKPAPFLQDALALLVEITGAQEGYLELYDDDDQADAPRWWIAHGLTTERIEHVRAATSRGIIAESIASGRTIVTPAAMLDPRFSHLESVRRASIQAVLCAPIGADRPRGVLYLTGQASGQPFSEEDRAHVELVTRHLAPLVDRVLLEQRRASEDDPTRPLRATLRLDGVVGRSAALAASLREVAIVAPSSHTVLLTGETGTGKSQLARILHDNSPRAGGPFVEVSCTALPETLVEAELFGAKRGAATGVDSDRIGYVARADHGTLFLDEIGDMPQKAQAALLRLLQSKQYNRLGSPAPLQADVRIIAGTNVDLERAVVEGRFRQDLFYRLDVVTIRMPSLAERREDIPELAAWFCDQECRKEGKAPRPLSRDALRALESAEWPGNVRQLEHTVIRGVLRAVTEGATQVERRHLFPNTPQPAAGPAPAATFEEKMNRFKAHVLREALEETGWNVVETARRLDLARSHLYNLIRAYGIERDRRS